MIARVELEHSISREYVRAFQVIHAALPVGGLLFFVIVVWFYYQTPPNIGAETEMPDILSIIHLVLGSQLYAIGWFLYSRHVKAETSWGHTNPTKSNGETTDSIEASLRRYRTASIIRLAMCEAVAFFGLVLCLLCAMSGLLQVQPIYWLNASSLVVLVSLAIATFPTDDRIVALLMGRRTNAVTASPE